MKNITVAVDDETYRFARIRAAELDTSVSALVRDYLRMLTTKTTEEPATETASERRGRLLREVVANFDSQGRRLRGPEASAQQGLYERAAARVEAEARRRSARNRGPRP
ncbi:MAG: hypothetical protein OXL97_08585 [Chloroflexota bacterium]|nr:hypothetical protein [Chloroflexota bacterium]MDE2885789.1 hypothetical protein [Chloroflexota bacterium]